MEIRESISGASSVVVTLCFHTTNPLLMNLPISKTLLAIMIAALACHRPFPAVAGDAETSLDDCFRIS